MTEIGKERGWPRMTRASFDAQRSSQGALLIGDPGANNSVETMGSMVETSENLIQAFGTMTPPAFPEIGIHSFLFSKVSLSMSLRISSLRYRL